MTTKIQKNSSFQDKGVFLRRARAKYLSKQLASKLIKENLGSSLIASYKETLKCSHYLNQEGKKVTTSYCKNRWCAVCNRIRTAKLISGYAPVLKSFKEPYFVTLTKKTVCEADLRASMDLMGKVWRDIMLCRDNRYKRKIKGIRKAECTIRPKEQYHYHYHVIIEGKDNAFWLIAEWLKRCPDSDQKAQDMRVADEGSFKELFKYFTKLTVKKKNVFELFPYSRMNVIFESMYQRKVFQSFGGLKMVSDDLENINVQEYEFLEECEKIWKWYESDWIDEWGECLTGYVPMKNLKYKIKKPRRAPYIACNV